MARRFFGHIQKLGPDYWRVFWHDNGNQRSHRLHGTRADAELYLAKVEAGIEGCFDNVTYADYWELVVWPQILTLEAKTQYGYERIWERLLAPHLNQRYVSKTTYRFAQGVIDGISAPSQQRKAAQLWKKICNMAIRDGILQTNPISRMNFAPANRRAKVVLEAGEMPDHLKSVRGIKYEHIILLEMCAGLRHEEACAIRASDVRFDGEWAFVTVDKAVVTVAGRKMEKGPKNAYSERVVPVTGYVRDRLGECRIQPINPGTAAHNFKRWCEGHGIRYVPYGDMRTNFTTHACECAPASLVDLYTGHSDGTVRMNHYQKSTETGMRAVAQAYSDYVVPQKRKPVVLNSRARRAANMAQRRRKNA